MLLVSYIIFIFKKTYDVQKCRRTYGQQLCHRRGRQTWERQCKHRKDNREMRERMRLGNRITECICSYRLLIDDSFNWSFYMNSLHLFTQINIALMKSMHCTLYKWTTAGLPCDLFRQACTFCFFFCVYYGNTKLLMGMVHIESKKKLIWVRLADTLYVKSIVPCIYAFEFCWKV